MHPSIMPGSQQSIWLHIYHALIIPSEPFGLHSHVNHQHLAALQCSALLQTQVFRAFSWPLILTHFRGWFFLRY